MLNEAKSEVIGFIGQDADVHTGQHGDFATVSVAVRYGKKDDEKTVWYEAVFSGDGAAKIAKHLTKGRYVRIKGVPTADAWIDSDGNARSKVVIRRANVDFLDSKKD